MFDELQQGKHTDKGPLLGEVIVKTCDILTFPVESSWPEPLETKGTQKYIFHL